MANMNSSARGMVNWQGKLDEACRGNQMSAPVFNIVSDRRGGRTAWSSQVSVQGAVHQARFWYDGNNLNNAREDAAEVAYTWLNGSKPSSAALARNKR